MSTCPKEDFCCAFVDGEVSSQLKKEFEEHLSQCEKCRQSVEQFKFLKNALISDEAPVLDLDKSFEKLLFSPFVHQVLPNALSLARFRPSFVLL